MSFIKISFKKLGSSYWQLKSWGRKRAYTNLLLPWTE